MSPAALDRFCMHCGSPGPFRDDGALKCTDCDRSTAIERAEYQKQYQRAKSEALRKLVAKHQDEFDRLLRTERLKQWRAAEKAAS